MKRKAIMKSRLLALPTALLALVTAIVVSVAPV
jgi:hypothetical protein